jgi:hypothetical protein
VIKGGRVACGGIHMSNIPQFPYRILCEERQILSVTNFTRQSARDFRSAASNAQVGTETAPDPLEAPPMRLSRTSGPDSSRVRRFCSRAAGNGGRAGSKPPASVSLP